LVNVLKMGIRKSIVFILIIVVCCFASCYLSGENKENKKDYDENMLDLRIYHENLGDALLSKNKAYAEWFVNDMDSILRSMAEKFVSYRKLSKPFRYEYEKRLAPHFSELKNDIANENWQKAINTYSAITVNCNECHTHYKIRKKVRDYTKQRST
jgi:hypothetical protein